MKYTQNTLTVAKKLLGKIISVKHGNHTISGRIIETEAYRENDPACHAYLGKKTKRTEPMFLTGGHIYIYFIYGMHYCLNIVTENKGYAAAVLIRAIQPLSGIKVMKANRGLTVSEKNLANGPGKLVQALGIKPTCNGLYLENTNCPITISGQSAHSKNIHTSTRIGINKGKNLLWRFTLTGKT